MFNFPIEDLRKQRRIGYFFRYPLEEKDFRPITLDDRYLGDFSAKALYNGVNDRGAVDRKSGFSGDIAALFVPSEARSADDASLLLTHVEPTLLVHPNGTRNWPVILDAARNRIHEFVRDDTHAGLSFHS